MCLLNELIKSCCSLWQAWEMANQMLFTRLMLLVTIEVISAQITCILLTPSRFIRLNPHIHLPCSALEQWIRDKYERKRFTARGGGGGGERNHAPHHHGHSYHPHHPQPHHRAPGGHQEPRERVVERAPPGETFNPRPVATSNPPPVRVAAPRSTLPPVTAPAPAAAAPPGNSTFSFALAQ